MDVINDEVRRRGDVAMRLQIALERLGQLIEPGLSEHRRAIVQPQGFVDRVRSRLFLRRLIASYPTFFVLEDRYFDREVEREIRKRKMIKAKNAEFTNSNR